ncbi:MAG: ATP-binding protein [Actinomycetota bacterium]|nr:ATP-binding protein [Actinomycetota bacterium]
MTRRLLVSYLAVTVVVLLILEIPLGLFYSQREIERLTAAVERDASVIASIYEDDLEAGRTLDAQSAQIYTERTGARVVVVDARGISLIDTGEATQRDFSTRPEIATALSGTRAVGRRPSATLDTDLLYVALPVASGGIVHGAVRLTLDTDHVDAQVRRLWLGLAAVAVVVLLLMGLVGWLLARSVTRPVRRLNEAALRFSDGDLRVGEAVDDGPPELQQLGRTMATMAERLAEMLDEQRAFVADASHQLRTPLTGLRLRLENMQSRSTDVDGVEVEAAIDEIDRLSALVADLLQLARADRAAPSVAHDVAGITTDRVDTWGAMAETREVSLVLHGAGRPAWASAVPGAIEQILDNVLDNALAVSPPGGAIEISVDRDGDECRLVIVDHGPGLSDHDKERALRRFWRGDASTPGTGLGLAIADALARSSHGRLTFTDTDGGGLSVALTLPSAPPPASA